MFRIIALKQHKFSQSDPVLIRQFSKQLQSDPVLILPKLASVLIQSDPVLNRAHLCFSPEMITIRFAGWISGKIVSLQPDTDIQKLLSNGIRISEMLLSLFLGFRLLENLRIAQSLI